MILLGALQHVLILTAAAPYLNDHQSNGVD